MPLPADCHRSAPDPPPFTGVVERALARAGEGSRMRCSFARAGMLPASAGGHLNKNPHIRRQEGFTLLEMLVALSVFSLAALALVKLVGENLRTTGIVEERIFASVVAENRAVEAMTVAIPPAVGETNGSEDAAERVWRWTRRVSETAEPGILRVDIEVRPEATEQVLATVTIFRGRR